MALEFSEFLKNRMKEQKLSLGRLSKATGISKSSIHSYLLGTEPQLGNLIILANFFRVSIDELTKGHAILEATDRTLHIKIDGSVFEVTIRKSK